MTKFYEAQTDRRGNTPPPPGSLAMALWLVRNPRKVTLINTTDGSPAPFLDDGGKIENGILTKPGQNRQLLTRSARRAREDKAFKGQPLFVAAEDLPPAFEGDHLHTGQGGWIIRMTPAHEKLIDASREVRAKGINEARAHGNAEIDHLRMKPNAGDPVAILTAALKEAGLGGGAKVAELEKELAETKAALAERTAPAGTTTSKKGPKPAEES